MAKIARISTGLFRESHYTCRHPWPDDCACQGGDDGLVIQAGGPSIEEALTDPDKALQIVTAQVPHYRTAFFEAFPRNPNTFLRGEGKTIEEAEAACWAHWRKIQACPAHEFERRGRTDGYCFCKHCNLSGSFMEPTTACCKCGVLTNWTTNFGLWYCQACAAQLKFEELDENGQRIYRMNEDFAPPAGHGF